MGMESTASQQEPMREAAARFVEQHARPLELAQYRVFFAEDDPNEVVKALLPFQNADGGFGHALEPDNWNPDSTPITTNDALLRLYDAGALDLNSDTAKRIAQYLLSGTEFDPHAMRWRFAVSGNIDHPHAIWWERHGDGIFGWNPTVSLAAFLVCMHAEGPWETLLAEAFDTLEQSGASSGDELTCFIFAWELLNREQIEGIIDVDQSRTAIIRAIDATVCRDTTRYSTEYVTMPSTFFRSADSPFLVASFMPLIQAELETLPARQAPDGGFDISWQWHTDYPEAFAQARDWWHPRVTLDKLRFLTTFTKRG